MLGTPRNELIEIDYMAKKSESPEAWLLEIEFREVWLPKSQCEIDEENSTILVPKWLCDEEDLHP